MGRTDSNLREYSMYKETHCNDKGPEQSKSQPDMNLAQQGQHHMYTYGHQEKAF